MSESSRPHEAMLADTSGPLKAGSFRELMSVAVPLVLSSGSLSLMIAIDRLFLTWFSEDALAASTPAAALHWTVMSAFIGTINYANAFVAQYEGAGRKDRGGRGLAGGLPCRFGRGPLSGFLAVYLEHLRFGGPRARGPAAGDTVLPDTLFRCGPHARDYGHGLLLFGPRQDAPS